MKYYTKLAAAMVTGMVLWSSAASASSWSFSLNLGEPIFYSEPHYYKHRGHHRYYDYRHHHGWKHGRGHAWGHHKWHRGHGHHGKHHGDFRREGRKYIGGYSYNDRRKGRGDHRHRDRH